MPPNQIEFYTVLGRVLERRRKIKNLTQTNLGNLVGCTGQQIQKYEYGTNRPNFFTLQKISKILDIDLNSVGMSIEQEAPKCHR